MYQSRKYRKKEPEYIFQFIKEHPFATMVLKGERMLATHVPVMAEGEAANFRLYSHIANHNEQADFLNDGVEVLLIFLGPHAYVSSSWYQDVDISTWDYAAVHVNAYIRKQTRAELEQSLEKLVNYFEKDQPNPAYYQAIPKPMLEEHLPLITGFWCEPYKVEAIAKLHQGFNERDVESVCRNLKEQNRPLGNELSELIKKEHGTDH